MSILDDDYPALVHAIRDFFVMPNGSQKELMALITNDIQNGPDDEGHLFHRKEELTAKHLLEKEIAISNAGDLAGEYRRDMNFNFDNDESNDGNLAFLEPTDGSNSQSLYPNVCHTYRHINLQPRGERTAIYDAMA